MFFFYVKIKAYNFMQVKQRIANMINKYIKQYEQQDLNLQVVLHHNVWDIGLFYHTDELASIIFPNNRYEDDIADLLKWIDTNFNKLTANFTKLD